MEETVSETTENYVTINPITKKKVRVVKKIVKKKIIKKVPKRNVNSITSNSNDLENVTSPNPNVSPLIEIEKPNVEIDGLKEVEDVKELLECSGVEMEVDESRLSGLVSLLGEQIHDKLQDGDRERIECGDGDGSGIGLQDSDQSRIDGDWSRIGLQDGDGNGTELRDCDQDRIGLQSAVAESSQNLIELQDGDLNWNQIESQDSDWNRIELPESEENLVELQDGDQNVIELQDDDQNVSATMVDFEKRIESVDREHDTNTKNVEEHEGEEGVKELINSETDGLKSQEAFGENEVLVEKTVISRLPLNQRKKIFIHGLGQETKEEDIRKVFEEVGEVIEVKLVINFRSGKNRGFGFITFASAELANLALTRYQNVEICGRPCRTSAIEGIDTILLNNIDKKWNKEHVVELLQKFGIKKVDEVLVVSDPNNAELNCGLAFLEFETKSDAQMAYLRLQTETMSGKHSNIKVSWASPNVDPVEEENKSVYAENIPLSWDEKEVNDHFKMFGEIESIALAKNLRTAKRNDFAFINYKTSEAALSCVEALTSKKSTSNNGPTGHLKVSLAKSIPKVKPNKTVSDSAVTAVSQAYQNANRARKSQNQQQNTYQSRQSQQNMSYLGVYKPPQNPTMIISNHVDPGKDSASSTTAELVQLLREQASWKQGGPSSTAGHYQPPFGRSQQVIEPGSKSMYHHDPRAYHQSYHIPNVTQPRAITNVTSFPRYDQQRVHPASGSYSFSKPDIRHIQARDQTTYPGSNSVYRRTH